MVQELSLIFPAYFANKAEQIQFANYVVYVSMWFNFFSIIILFEFLFSDFEIKKKPQSITESGLSNLTMKKLTSFFFNFGSFTS